MRKFQLTSLASRIAVALVVAAVGAGVLAAAPSGVVNINDASADELALLPRIGPSVSQRIVEFRDANGTFGSAEELLLVRGIGERTFALLEPFVTVEGETTLTEKVKVSELESASEAAPE